MLQKMCPMGLMRPISLIGMKISDSIRQFLEYVEIERGRSVLTLRNYQFYLERFLKWIDSRNEVLLTNSKSQILNSKQIPKGDQSSKSQTDPGAPTPGESGPTPRVIPDNSAMEQCSNETISIRIYINRAYHSRDNYRHPCRDSRAVDARDDA